MVLAGPHFKVIFHDAQVHLGVEPAGGLRLHRVSLQSQEELLLVHGGRRQQSGFDAGLKPIREGAFCLYHLLYGFALMGYALRCSIAQGNDNAQLFAAVENKCSLDLALGHGNPAGVQPQLLGQEDKPLSIVAAAFLQRGALLADHCDFRRQAETERCELALTCLCCTKRCPEKGICAKRRPIM